MLFKTVILQLSITEIWRLVFTILQLLWFFFNTFSQIIHNTVEFTATHRYDTYCEFFFLNFQSIPRTEWFPPEYTSRISLQARFVLRQQFHSRFHYCKSILYRRPIVKIECSINIWSAAISSTLSAAYLSFDSVYFCWNW